MRLISINLPDDHHAALKYCARRDFKDMNEIVCWILSAYIETQQIDYDVAYELVERDRRRGRRKKKDESVVAWPGSSNDAV